MDSLPDSGVEFNIRAYEMQCCNLNGMDVDDWYNIPVGRRCWKVAGMLLPSVMASLQSVRETRDLKLPKPVTG